MASPGFSHGVCAHPRCRRVFRRKDIGDQHCPTCERKFLLVEVAKAIQQSMDLTVYEEMVRAGFDKFRYETRRAMASKAGITLSSEDLRLVWNYLLSEPHPIGNLPEVKDEPEARRVIETESVKHGRGGFEVH